jgi:hypothetical protein
VSALICPNCWASNAMDARFCASCGVRFPHTAEAAPEPYTTIELRRLTLGDDIALAATVLLFFALLLPWYTLLSGVVSVNALGVAAGGWRFLILLDCVVVLLYLFFRTMAPPSLRLPLPHWQLLTLLTGVNLLLTALTFLVRPGGGLSNADVGMDYGSYLGLAAAAAALAGGLLRGWEREARGGSSHPR